MGRPPKDKRLLMNIPLRVMVTEDQKKLIDQVVVLEGGEFSDWARAVLLEAAKRRVAKSAGEKRERR